MVDTTMVENIFEDFDQQDFANSQEYFDYLKNKQKATKHLKHLQNKFNKIKNY